MKADTFAAVTNRESHGGFKTMRQALFPCDVTVGMRHFTRRGVACDSAPPGGLHLQRRRGLPFPGGKIMVSPVGRGAARAGFKPKLGQLVNFCAAAWTRAYGAAILPLFCSGHVINYANPCKFR